MKPLATELKERQAEQTERCIAEQMAKLTASQHPTMDYTAGMIDLGYVQGHYTNERRAVLMEQLRRIVNERRKQLQQQRMERLIGRTA